MLGQLGTGRPFPQPLLEFPEQSFLAKQILRRTIALQQILDNSSLIACAPGLLAHIVVSRYDDHLPLYRQAEIYARDGVSLETSTLSGWVGATAVALAPLVDAPAAGIMGADTLHVDDTPVPVWAPARPKPGGYGSMSATSGRSPVPDRRRRCSATRPIAKASIHAPTSKSSPASFTPTGIPGLTSSSRQLHQRSLCWAHVRRKFFGIHAATGSPIAKEALDRIGQLYGVEKAIRGFSPVHRRRERQQRARPIAEALAEWADETARKLSRKSELAAAIRYMRARHTALGRCIDDGRLALDNNPAERPCAASRSAAKTISSPAPTPAATAPPRCTR
jgi:transposase